jgi:hypothetical protein
MTVVTNVKKIFYIIIILSSLLFSSQAFALIEGVGLGGISTVAPSNAYDVDRNPAMMTNGSTGLTLFGALESMVYTNLNMESTQKVYAPLKTETLKEKNDLTYSLTIPLGFTINKGNWAAGLLISSGQDPLYKKEKHNTTIIIDQPTLPEIDKDTVKVEKTKINPKIEFGAGIKTGPYSSFGITFYNILTKSIKSEKHDSINVANGMPVAIFEKVDKEEKIEFGGVIGFHQMLNKFEAGLTINTGSFGFITKEKEYTNSGATTKEKTSKKFTMLTSPTVSIGLLYKANSAVDFVSELQYTLSSEHTEEEIEGETTMTILENKSSTLYGSSTRMGLRFHVSPSLTMMTGAGFLIQEGKIHHESSTSNRTIHTRLMAGLFTIGGDYKHSDNFSMGISLINVYYTISYDAQISGADFKVRGKVYELQAITGFSYKI